MNEPVSVSILQKHSQKACIKCGMESPQGCCHDEVSIIKLTDSHAGATANINLNAPDITALQLWPISNFEKYQTTQIAYSNQLPPLLLSKTDPQAFIGVFLI